MAETDREPVSHEREIGNGQAGQAGKGLKGEGRKHGKGFIYMSLRDADEALRKIDHHAKQMSVEGFARALGHDAPKGRFLYKVEALEDYKLAELDGDLVKLTGLATDMLYGASESARTKSRATAFLNYEEFRKAFTECPKGQDHQMSYLVDFVKAKLGIVNEVERFQRLFLDSAHFAGLLEGEADVSAKVIRLRPAVLPMSNSTCGGDLANSPQRDPYTSVPLDEVDVALDSFGLAAYRDRSELSRRNAGTVELKVADGKIAIEIHRPVRVTIRANDLVSDLPEIIRCLRERGFQA